MMRAPCGIAEIEALYGTPAPYLRDDGTISPLWEMRMCKVALPGPLPLGWRPEVVVKACRVNEAIAGATMEVLVALSSAKAWDYIYSYDGGYAWRSQRGSPKLSMHGYGGALDFNAATNRLGEHGDMARVVVEVFEGHGWQWGGRWGRPDPMHFQLGRGY